MKRLFKNIIGVVFFLAMINSPYARSDTKSSINIYTNNLNNLFISKNDKLSLDGMEYNQNRNDFTIRMSMETKGKYNPKLDNLFIDRTDKMILSIHSALISYDSEVSNLFSVLSSEDIGFDNFVRDNLNIVFVLNFVDSSFLVVSNKNGIRSFKDKILTEDELNESINFFLNSRP